MSNKYTVSSVHFAPLTLKMGVCHCIFHRERERELYGPKKRGPKPKTFLLKVNLAFSLFFFFFFMNFMLSAKYTVLASKILMHLFFFFSLPIATLYKPCVFCRVNSSLEALPNLFPAHCVSAKPLMMLIMRIQNSASINGCVFSVCVS